MNEQYRGGNGRQLVRLLEQFPLSVAILDRSGQIVFVNSALCQMAKLEVSSLVGQRCSWKIAADSPASAILTALAPPASALEGRALVRQLTVPIVFGATDTGQVFLPMCDREGVVQWTMVILGDLAKLQQMLPSERLSRPPQVGPDLVLQQIRSRWKTLDNLGALIGTSPAIEMAMLRAQMAIRNPCNILIQGPAGVGKLELSQGVYLGRIKAASSQLSSGQYFPLDCRVLDLELIDSMLEIFTSRLQPELPRVSQNLVLIGVDRLSEAGLQRLLNWTNTQHERCWIMATSSLPATQLTSRGSAWSHLIHRLASIEICLPGLVDRREDIGPLALHALADECQRVDRAQLSISADVSDRLVAYPWPGNIRQLRLAIQHAVQQAVLTSSIQVSHLPLALRTFAGSSVSEPSETVTPIHLDSVLLDVERRLLQRALKLSPRNRARAARLLGISRPRLLRRVEQLGLETNQPESEQSDKSD